MAKKCIQLDESILYKNKVPILVKDETWLKLFGHVEERSISNLKEELEKLLSEERNIERKISDLQKEKLDVMKMILSISSAVNNEEKVESLELLDEYREKLLNINDEIDELTFRLETIPTEMRELNLKLLEATASYGYAQLKEKEEKLDRVVDELEGLKERVKELINLKYDYEEWVNAAYTFLHGMLGSEQMEKLDRNILE